MSAFRNAPRGMTYVEILVYIFVVSIILLSFGYFAVNLLYDRTRGSAQAEVRENARLGMERIIREIERAEGIRTASSTFSTNLALPASGGMLLSLQMSSSTIDPTEIRVLNNVLHIKQGSATGSPITASNVRITQLQFENFSVGKARNVGVTLTTELLGIGIGPSGGVSTTLRSTAELRNR